MSRPGLATALAALAVGVGVGGRAAASPGGPADQLRALAAAGRHEEVVARAAGLVDALPPDARPAAWRIDFRRTMISDIRLGRDHLYLAGMSNLGPVPGPARLDPLPGTDPPDSGQYGNLLNVTCVAGATGRLLWTRRFLPHAHLALDPRDDALWTWHRDPGTPILRVDPASGAATTRGVMPPHWAGRDAPRGLRADGLRLWSLATANTRDLEVDEEFDLDEGVSRPRVFHPDLLSRNGLRALTRSAGDETVRLVPAVAGLGPVPDWSFAAPGSIASPPAWAGDDVLVLAGRDTTNGVATRLNGRTGQARWEHALPEPAAAPGKVPLGAGFYSPHGWSAIGPLAGRVVAAGALGTAFVLDPEAGDEVGRVSAGAPFLALPRVVAGRLVLASRDGVRAIPLPRCLGGPEVPDDWADLQRLRGRSLLSLGRAGEAADVAGRMARDRPDDPRSWALLAEAWEATGRGDAAVAARAAALAAGESRVDPRLQGSHGLLARLPTAPISAAPVVAGPLLLVGCRDGQLLTVDPLGPRVVAAERAPTDIARLRLDAGTLVRLGDDRRAVPVRRLLPPPGDLQAFDPLLTREEPPGLPKAWYDTYPSDPPAAVIGDRRVRPTRHGGVRVLRGGEVTARPAAVDRLEQWRIALIAGRPVGYGTGGVYRLDEGFLPVEKIVTVDPIVGRSAMAFHLAGDEETLCVLIGAYDKAKLQVRSRDGSRLIREEPARPARGAFDEPARLRPLGGGYLLSAGELLWVPATGEGKAWRFRVRLDPDAGPSRPEFADDNADFGVARVVGDRLFAAAHGGGIYCFSLEAVTGGAAPRADAAR